MTERDDIARLTTEILPPLSRQAQSYRARRADQHNAHCHRWQTRDERQASQVVAEANQNLLSKQKAVPALWRALRHRIN
jgi:hypothetical protein